MKNSINQKICSLILSIVLTALIISCVFNLTGTTEPQKPKQVIEAPIFQNLRALYEWAKTFDWSKISPVDRRWKFRYLPDPRG